MANHPNQNWLGWKVLNINAGWTGRVIATRYSRGKHAVVCLDDFNGMIRYAPINQLKRLDK